MSDGIVYVSSWDFTVSYNGRLSALAASTGELLWKYEVEGPTFSPFVSDGVVYLGVPQAIHALDASVGRLLWEYEVEGLFGLPPAVSDGVLYVGSVHLYALALAQPWQGAASTDRLAGQPETHDIVRAGH